MPLVLELVPQQQEGLTRSVRGKSVGDLNARQRKSVGGRNDIRSILNSQPKTPQRQKSNLNARPIEDSVFKLK